MTHQRVQLQPCYILHHRAYRDTSLLLEVFSRAHGRVGVVARGARGKRSRYTGLLQPFRPLLLSWSGKGELGTLTGAEPDGVPLDSQGPALISGFYLNELLMRLIGRGDPLDELYDHYALALHRLALGEGESVLRRFEVELLQQLGYGLILDHDAATGEAIEVERRYRYSLEQGPLALDFEGGDEIDLIVHGRTLLGLESGELEGASVGEAKRLMRAALAPHLGDRPLKSRELFLAMYGAKKSTPT